ncbi:uncharacterized protein LOC108664965 isoform X2 [Hyalella azteca]|uniref:Uncharacterized protein LOC108664965 isoform X2 n=1 Tax=Hyalella azteca TaxID=294128 RepID=A0A8B7N0T2_HYAAZ|nr:uncharacterized protein LOC108664965 isoform X2 [Hyalella azteca]
MPKVRNPGDLLEDFASDPFFNESLQEFDRSLQRAMGRSQKPIMSDNSWCGGSGGTGAVSRCEPDAYSSQDLRVTEKDGRYQVVMDVKNFDPRNLQVRVVDDNRIVVEGKYEQKSADGASSAWKTFSKEFTMPDEADIDLVTTALSKEGVLTVRAPRKAQSINESYNQQKTQDGVSTKSTKSTSSTTASSYRSLGNKNLQSSSSFESNDSGLDSLPRDLRDRLMVNESGFSSVSSSNSSCSSPAPSETPSDMSRISTSADFDVAKNANNNQGLKSDATYSGETPEISGYSQQPQSRVWSPSAQSVSSRYSNGSKIDNYSPRVTSPVFMPPAVRIPIFTAGCASSGDTTVTVEEKDGKRIVKSEKANVIQEAGGLLEAKEIASEIEEKDGQSARREAVTRIQRKHDDPQGRYKGAEQAEAADASESSIRRLPDGSTVSVKKTSTSSSSQKIFSSTGMDMSAFDDPFFNVGFPHDFGDLRSLTGRGHTLMSQMSNDSIASSLSGRSQASHRSGASDMSNRSRLSNQSDPPSDQASVRSSFSGRSSSSASDDFMRDSFGFPRGSLFANRPSLAERFPEFSGALAEFDDFPRMGFGDFPSLNTFSRSSRNSNSSFSSSSSYESPFDRKFN